MRETERDLNMYSLEEREVVGPGDHFLSAVDSQVQDAANPFSFKEFVKSKHLPRSSARFHPVVLAKDKSSLPTPPAPPASLGPPESPSSLSLEYKDSFLTDPTLHEDPLDDDDDEGSWCENYYPSVIEHVHNTSDSSSPTESSASDTSNSGAFQPWHFTSINACASSSRASHPAAEDLRLLAMRANNQELQEENTQLKKKLVKLKELNQHQAERVKNLEKKLEEKIMREEEEAQDLEAMVQQVENNLQMMTKRATKAESNLSKVKQEVTLLQIQLSTYKSENEALRRGETAGMIAVKQNTNLALENLHKVLTGARDSIRQLLTGAETLNLVGDLLRSIDKIAEVHEDDVP